MDWLNAGPASLLDLGCQKGSYSVLSVASTARRVSLTLVGHKTTARRP